MPLTDIMIKSIKPGPKPRKFFDEKGMFLLVGSDGSRGWRLKYRFGGKERLISLGNYPEVTLKEARVKRDKERAVLASGVDPSQERKRKKAKDADRLGNTFSQWAHSWLEVGSTVGHGKWGPWGTGFHRQAESVLAKDILPQIGEKPVAEVSGVDIETILKRIQERGAPSTARQAFLIIGGVIRFAIRKGKTTFDPTVPLRLNLVAKTEGNRVAAIDPKLFGEILRAIDGWKGPSRFLQDALKLLPHLFVRGCDLRAMRWEDVNLERAEWTFRQSKTRRKTKERLTVPLSRQVVTILKELFKFSGDGEFVFPSHWGRGKCLSPAALLCALRRMGIGPDEHSIHGFRASARTLLSEVLGYPPEVIEMALGHKMHKGPLGDAYDRATFLPQRRKMMQEWSDYLDSLKTMVKVSVA